MIDSLVPMPPGKKDGKVAARACIKERKADKVGKCRIQEI